MQSRHDNFQIFEVSLIIQDRFTNSTIGFGDDLFVESEPMYKSGLIILSAMFLGSVSIANAGKSWKNQEQARTQNDFTYDAKIEVRFSNYDREMIQRYYYGYGKRKGLPSGLAKKGKLPPGLQKQIARNGQLPPGLQAKYLPYDLEKRLDRLPRNYVRLRIGTDIVLMDIPTRVILDVIKDIGN